MPSVPQILKMRRMRQENRNPSFHRVGWSITTLLSLIVVIVLIGGTNYYRSFLENLPVPETIPLLLEPPDGLLLQPTQFFDRSGEHLIYSLENPAVSERVYLNVKSDIGSPDEFIPASIITATIAISDPTFWNNPGFSRPGAQENAHNTLAQRLVSELLLWDEPASVRRVWRGRILAAQLTNQFGRTKILEWYLNSTNYGNLAFGIDAAARSYFGKSAPDLNLAEAAILAAVAEAPALNPHDAPQTALERGRVVIDAMLGQELITPAEAEQTRSLEINFAPIAEATKKTAPVLINLTWDQLATDIPLQRLERGGFTIITSLNYDLQLQTECAVAAHLARISGDTTFTNKAADGSNCQPVRLLPSLTFEENPNLVDLSANVVVLDPFSGEILAIVGNPSSSPQDDHPAGSLLTPFIYLTAFTRGYSPASLVWDIPSADPDFPTWVFSPSEDYQGPLRLRNALANDYIIPVIQLVNQIGLENVLRITRQLGLDTFDIDPNRKENVPCPGCQLLLDSTGVSLIDLTQAYGVFSNRGILVGHPAESQTQYNLHPLTAITVLKVNDATNRTWISELPRESRPVVSPQLAYLMTHILSDEAARWPTLGHPNPLEIGRPAGAKMGQSFTSNDVWTVGFTPQLVVGTWLGSETPIDENRASAKLAAALWRAIVQHATQEFPPNDWALLPGVTQMEVCDPSGMLPTLQCPTIVSEVFLTGQEPTQPDNLYQTYQVNKETERLATVFTPPELVEERVYLNIPLEAGDWAKSIGLKTPPEIYDVIYTPLENMDAQITTPSMFDHLSGQVNIKGRVSGTDFESYRLQFGAGLNPVGWIVIQDDRTVPVETGNLGIWDTAGLNGLYAVQLVVLRAGQRIETTTIQVTVDNLPPSLSISYPEDGQIFEFEKNSIITFQAQTNDNLGLKQVEYFIGKRSLATQIAPPFAFPWRTNPGEHELKIVSTDLAGNQNEEIITFIVK
jgi:membrane carboxypeptidase/penicillin-binding protein